MNSIFNSTRLNLKSIHVVIESGNLLLETLSLTDAGNNLTNLASSVQRITVHCLPMIEHALREGLATSVRAEISSETEGLHDRQVGLDGVQRSTGALLLSEHVSTSTVEHTIDTTHGVFGTLDLDQVDGLEHARLSGQLGSVDSTTARRNDLVTTTVNGISVKGDIENVVSATTHVLLSKDTLTSDPGESSSARILDFVEVLDSLGDIEQKVGAGGIRAEAPDAATVVLVNLILGLEELGTSLDIVTRTNFALLDLIGKTIRKRTSLHVDTVVLVGGL